MQNGSFRMNHDVAHFIDNAIEHKMIFVYRKGYITYQGTSIFKITLIILAGRAHGHDARQRCNVATASRYWNPGVPVQLSRPIL